MAGRTPPSTAAGATLEERFSAAMVWLARSGAGFSMQRPRLAVGLSGGSDSLALTALLADWTAERGGSLHAFTVDHGLRPGSRQEAEAAGEAARRLDLQHRILTWDEPRKGAALQARARAARLGLMEAACEEAGLSHLFLGHTLEDQAETFLLRLQAASDLPGLACMAAMRSLRQVVLCRPLLGERRAALRSYLESRGLAWSEDPSNLDDRFTRVRLRRLLPGLAEEGVTPELLAGTARGLGQLRARLERLVDERLARAADPLGLGAVRLQPDALLEEPRELALWSLARVLRTVGGEDYAPRGESLSRLLSALCEPGFSGATLGGCRILPQEASLLVFRELAATPDEVRVDVPGTIIWDRRFCMNLSAAARGSRLRPLGERGWRGLCRDAPERAAEIKKALDLPLAALLALPALFDDAGLAEVPPLDYRRADLTQPLSLSCEFSPLNPLKHECFTVAPPERHIIY